METWINPRDQRDLTSTYLFSGFTQCFLAQFKLAPEQGGWLSKRCIQLKLRDSWRTTAEERRLVPFPMLQQPQWTDLDRPSLEAFCWLKSHIPHLLLSAHSPTFPPPSQNTRSQLLLLFLILLSGFKIKLGEWNGRG